MNTGGGYVFNAMKTEFCATSMPGYCSGSELAETGGAWLDAPDFFPAGGMCRFSLSGSSDPAKESVVQRIAGRY